jgi:hypothetical protein
MFLETSQKVVVWGFVNGAHPVYKPPFSRFVERILIITKKSSVTSFTLY